jgi:acetyltransferase
MYSANETTRAIDRIFNARSIAVVGASNDPTKYGYMTLNSIIEGGYKGRLYAVNPKGGEILGIKVYRSLSEIPEQLDVVAVIVPAKHVSAVLREAGIKGARGAIIFSAGFREVGQTALEDEILAVSKRLGMRLMGPNIQGINYLPNKLCAMFFPVIKTRGPIAIITQSGSITATISQWAEDEGLGISAAVNLGNQVDLCEADYVNYFAGDQNTKVIALYLEGLKNGRQFLESVRTVAYQKPIVILKGGRTSAGKKSAASHTGSMAGRDEVFTATLSQYGMVCAKSMEAFYDSAKALATIDNPDGNRLLIISTSGGANTLAADEAEAVGLILSTLSEEFVEELKKQNLSPLATFSNPLDMAGNIIEHFRKAALLADKNNVADIFLLNFADPVPGAVDVVKDIAAQIKARLVVSYMGGGCEEKTGRYQMQRAGIPVFPTPERAVRAIAAAAFASHFRRMRASPIPIVDKLCIGERLSSGEKIFLPEPQAIQYLKLYEIPYPEHGLAKDADMATTFADKLGYPVVMKIVSPDVSHKTDIGGVLTDLRNPEDVRSGFDEMIAQVKKEMPAASISGVLVARQIEEGLDVIIGGLNDPVFGPTVMFGIGGIYTELYKDVTFKVIPLNREDAEEMVHTIKGYPIIAGFRGQKRYDEGKLIETLLSVSQLMMEHPEIRELDLNPLRLLHDGLVALDVRVYK